jgi:thioredoxin reductase (NADPH)
VKAYFNSSVTEILPDSVGLQTPDGNISIRNDFVLAMIGYSPDLTFLNANGIVLEPDTQKPRTDPDTLESDRRGVFLAGVIVAGMHTNEIFIENGRFHGRQIAEAIQSQLARVC